MSIPETMYEPFLIGSRFRIGPPGVPHANDGRIDLIIRRGAFGSGEHETTASCLQALENLPSLAGARVLDFGSGTGILAVAALKLGARCATCIDIDPRAVECAKINACLNGFADRIEHLTGSVETIGAGRFDLVLANLYGDVLLELGRELVHMAAPGGYLIFSGVLLEDSFNLREAVLKLGCIELSSRILLDYSTIVFGVTSPH